MQDSLFIQVSIFIHVFAASTALTTGMLAMVFRKETPKHRIVGKIYFWAMFIVFLTGVELSIIRESLFFFFIAGFTFYACAKGYRSLYLKELHKGQKPEFWDWLVAGLGISVNVGLVGYGVYMLTQSNWNAMIPLTFGLFGSKGVYEDTVRYFVPPTQANHWLKVHIEGMMGSYIGAITAFMVNQGHLFPFIPQPVLWLAPGILLGRFVAIEIRKISPVQTVEAPFWKKWMAR